MLKNDVLIPEELPRLEQIEMQAVQPDYLKIRCLNVILYLLLIGIVLGLISYDPMDKFEWIQSHKRYIFIPFVCLSIGWLFVVYFGFKNRKYALREKDISGSKGLLFYKLTTIPIRRILHLEIHQNWLSKRFGLVHLKVLTAGTGDDLYIKGLSKKIAENIKGQILNQLNETV